jgi:Ras-related protein Rab-18
MVYDVTRRDSFENLEQWLKEVKLYSPNNGEGVVKLLVGNKIDLKENRKVSREEAEAWARSQGMLFLEASAKTRTGIKQCFMEVVHKIVEDPELLINTVPGRPKVTLYPDTRRVDGSGSGNYSSSSRNAGSLLSEDGSSYCC